MTDDHRPRPASGVMGYVARYQQFDPEATHAGTGGPGDVPSDRHAAGAHHPAPGRHEAPPASGDHQPPRYDADRYDIDGDEPYMGELSVVEPADKDGWDVDQAGMNPERQEYPDPYGSYANSPGAYWEPYPPAENPTAVFAGPVERLIDLSAPRTTPVEHRRPGQARNVMLAVAALAVMAAGATGYVLLRSASHNESTTASVHRPPEVPEAASVLPGDGSVPNGEPVHTVPTSHVAASATTPPPPVTVVTTAPTVISVVPLPTLVVPVRTGTPVRTSAPASTTAPAAPGPTGGSAPTSAPVTPLTATYSYRTDDEDADPITGYVGTIRVTNPGDTAAGSWTVRLTVPSGATGSVESGDVTATGDGDRLTFHPTAATIAAHSSVTFTFTLDDPLTALPAGCTVNGANCD